MLMRVSKKQQKEDLKMMIKFVKENHVNMYNIIMNIKSLMIQEKEVENK